MAEVFGVGRRERHAQVQRQQTADDTARRIGTASVLAQVGTAVHDLEAAMKLLQPELQQLTRHSLGPGHTRPATDGDDGKGP